MNLNQLKALATSMTAPKAEPKKEKPRYRVRDGKIVIRLRAVLADKPKRPTARILNWPTEKPGHVIGEPCPHCQGTGQYRWHIDPNRVEKCYRCNGNGNIGYADIRFLERRLKGAGPVCHIQTA